MSNEMFGRGSCFSNSGHEELLHRRKRKGNVEGSEVVFKGGDDAVNRFGPGSAVKRGKELSDSRMVWGES